MFFRSLVLRHGQKGMEVFGERAANKCARGCGEKYIRKSTAPNTRDFTTFDLLAVFLVMFGQSVGQPVSHLVSQLVRWSFSQSVMQQFDIQSVQQKVRLTLSPSFYRWFVG